MSASPSWWDRNALRVTLPAWATLVALTFDPKPSTGGDDSTYVLLARALASGQGLVETWTVGAPAHTQYPFGFPLLLSPLVALGVSFGGLKLVVVVAGGLSLWLTRRLLGPAVMLALALNTAFLGAAHLLLSELPFLALTLASLLFVERWKSSSTRLHFALALGFAVGALHVRTAGLAVLVGIGLWLVTQRRWRAALAWAGGAFALCLPWQLRNALAPASGGYTSHVLAVDPYNRDLGLLDASGFARRVLDNLVSYGSKHLPDALAPGLPLVLAIALVTVPVLIGLVLHARRGFAAHDWVVVTTLGILVVYPAVWADTRFVLPIVPFLLLAAHSAWTLVLRARVALALVLLAPGLVLTAKEIPANVQMLGEFVKGDPLAGYPAAFRSVFRASEWLATHTPADAVVVSRKPTLVALASGRRTFCYPFTTDVEVVRRALFTADLVMIEPISRTGEQFLRPAVEPLVGERLFVVYADGQPPVHVLSVRR